ncbi:hypothetical protein CYMTET_22421 [Cymbomonas tetramitiformis]|uniref:Uncharacterized protein n=1 Tax=Cymbomonas tetramitiformis TaxID=36881 RepID=A0AAE0L257_9CHLO|nr:hypothetical protein CYMTET_22421 [Cymbomonas tetramitiformis]
MATLRSGMNVTAFDNDPAMTSSTSMCLQNFEDEPDAAEETRAKKAPYDEAGEDAPPAELQDNTDDTAQ